MSEKIEHTILRNLFCNEEYTRKVIPFIKPEYFVKREEQLLYQEVFNFIENYKNPPTKDTLINFVFSFINI